MNLDKVIAVPGCSECAGGRSGAWSSTVKSMDIAEWDEFYSFQFSSLGMICCGGA